MRAKTSSKLARGFVFLGLTPHMIKTSSLADFGDILTPADVQQFLGIGRNATYELLASGKLTSVRITPRRLIVTKKALEAFLGLAANIPSAGTP
jgi:hypothetical protein